METVTIQKLVHGGQGLAELSDGRKVFVWNALPSEKVVIRIIKAKRSYAEAIAEEVLEASPERVEPREENYLATSPWQMMTFEAENRYKADIVAELFAHERIQLPVQTNPSQSVILSDSEGSQEILRDAQYDMGADAGGMTVVTAGGEWNYRNKMEYSFWGDDDGLHLALHQRGSHGKQIVQGSELALPALDTGANAVLAELQKLQPRAGDLKTIIVRVSQNGDVVAALYTKLDKFTKMSLPSGVKGLRVYHSNPKSPASVPTKLLYELGDATLQDELLGKTFAYDVDSFFQVNLPIYEKALSRIREQCQADPVDMYAGTGSIGLSVSREHATLVELDPATVAMARVNAEKSGVTTDVVEASTEKALEYIVADKPVIFDPPRAGLHAKVVERCLEIKPPQIIYLSCNPATQARDLALLQESYEITFFEVYNFFPRTPHIETLAVLKPKQ
ncbi:class I SAM-dependent RNA methyltransferase [Candidatus Saccharibacteria bacterium]|nr:MAG: class I SAM-dependent RNA methyltransferase [Candidatus Saccharibacteria bacterium]